MEVIAPRRLDTVFYCRFIDDLLFITSDADADLGTWLSYFNNNDLNLNFTGTLQPHSIEFLDVKLTGTGNSIHTTLYRKPTAGNALLRADSAHPKHTIRGVPYGQFLRLKRLCSTPESFHREAHSMAQRFRNRGYGAALVNRALDKASTIPRHTLLQDKLHISPPSINIPVFSTPYSAEFNQIRKIVTKYLPILYNDAAFNNILSKGIKVVSRRAPTLGNSLSPSLVVSEQRKANWLNFKGNYKCGKKGCNYCSHIKKGKQVQSCTNGKVFNIASFIICNTQFIIYVITCDICQIQYVGRTTRRLRDRLYDHLYDIEKDRLTNVAKHWIFAHQKDVTSLHIQGIEKIVTPTRGGDRFQLLCKRKVYWIFSLNTRIPLGLNFEWDVSYFYE